MDREDDVQLALGRNGWALGIMTSDLVLREMDVPAPSSVHQAQGRLWGRGARLVDTQCVTWGGQLLGIDSISSPVDAYPAGVQAYTGGQTRVATGQFTGNSVSKGPEAPRAGDIGLSESMPPMS